MGAEPAGPLDLVAGDDSGATHVATATDAGTASHRRGFFRRVIEIEELGVLTAMAVLVIVIASFHSSFFTAYSLSIVASSASFYGIMALGMVFLLAMREIDLSVGGIYGVSIIVGALCIEHGMNPWLAALIALAVATSMGLTNGILSNILGIRTIIITLGTLSAYRGLALILSDSKSISLTRTDSSFYTILGGHVWGLDASVWAMFGLTIVLTIVFKSTRFGYTVRAIGSNEQAARLGGIRIGRIRLGVMALMGALAGTAGMLTMAYYGGADPLGGTGYELFVIAAAIIGGTGLAGGSGTVVGAMLGALLIALIQSGLVQFGVTANWSAFVTGIVIIVSVALDSGVRKLRRRLAGTG
jgi:ribose transport system permease protein